MNIASKITLIVALLIIISQGSYARRRIPYGDLEKIIKVMDFPDTEMFQLEDGSYFDLGSKYTKSHIAYLSYSNTDAVLVGYIPDKPDTYIELTPEQLTEIGKELNIAMPTTGKVSFFDKVVGRVLLGLLGFAIFYGAYLKYIKRE